MTDPRGAKPGERLTKEQVDAVCDAVKRNIVPLLGPRALLQLHADLAEANAKLARVRGALASGCDCDPAFAPHCLAHRIDRALADEPEEMT